MANQIFLFPGFYGTEQELVGTSTGPIGVPAGIIGSTIKGPAFVPVTVGSFADYVQAFGITSPRHISTYAAEKFLNNQSALTFMRVLGAGSNELTADFSTTVAQGTVKNAGFRLSSSQVTNGSVGSVQFLVARHIITGSEAYGFPMFSNNDSYFNSGALDEVYLTRGMIFSTNDAKIKVLSHNESYSNGTDDFATANSTTKYFKVVISSSAGTSFSNDEGFAGIRIITASFDPADDNYFAKVLNTDPEQFSTYKHVVYSDYAIDATIATVGTGTNNVAILSGSANTSSTSGDTAQSFRQAFGRFDTRYTNAKTSWFISQPFGKVEYDLFYFESLDDGQYPNDKYKISIANIQASTNPRSEVGSFTVLIRAFGDSDVEQQILEQYPNVNLDPESDNYIAKKIGDRKYSFSFDTEDENDRRLVVNGKYPNASKFVRIVMNSTVDRKLVPSDVVPFGFRGPQLLNTNTMLMDMTGSAGIVRLAGSGSASADPRLLAAIVPPIPYTFKVTRGEVSTTAGSFVGAPGNTEIADSRYYWGVKFGKVGNVLNSNITNETSNLVYSLTKFTGITKLDTLVTGTYTDSFNDNKFTLARVALNNGSLNDLTTSVNNHIRETAYIRNAEPEITNYTVVDPSTSATRITFATLLQRGATSTVFNRFSEYAKFTNIMYGGFDGTNILDKNAATLNDRACSTEARGTTYGNAYSSFVSPGFAINQNGVGLSNSSVSSYRTAIKMMTDKFTSFVNVLATPGQREPLIVDYAVDKMRDYDLGIYLVDVPNYNSDGDRIFDGETGVYVDVEQTAATFENRALDNEFGAAYFPNIQIDDNFNNRKVFVPASVGGLAAIAYNDKVSYPWFAPAGFNRAALDFVSQTQVRLKQSERERLYQIDINPIVKFPGETSFVIFAQNTLKKGESQLQSINVQRMVGDLKRQIIDIGNRLIFDNITPEIYGVIRKSFADVLQVVQSRQGLEKFRIICDTTNNTSLDVENNKINCSIIFVPTRAIEFIQLNFVISSAGVEFV